MTTRTAPATRSTSERTLLWLEILLAMCAYAGGVGLVSGGVDLGEAAVRLPLGSTVLAGVALILVNGVLPTVVVVASLLRRTWARTGHVVVGVALIGWIVVQVAFLGPPVHWLQVLYFAWGWTILVVALRLRARADAP